MTPPALLLTYDFPPMLGGIARALGEIARHAEGRIRVSTGQVDGWEAWDQASGLPVDRLAVPSRRLKTLPCLVRWGLHADRLVRQHHPAFLWAGNVKPAGHVARWLGTRRGLPYGLITYGLDLELLHDQARRSPRRRRAIRELVAGAAGAVAISGWTRDRYVELAELLGLPAGPDRVRVVPLGVDTQRFAPRAAGGPRAGSCTLLTVARLVPHKGVDEALALLAGLRAEGHACHYVVAGEGPDRPRLEALAAELGVAGQVRFLGAVSEAELPALYQAANVYVGLSRVEGPEVEGFGLSLLEAQAAGLPVLAGRGGGTAECVEDGVSGLLLPPTDRREVLAAAMALLRQPERAHALGLAGRARAERRFTWARVVADLEAAARAFTPPAA